MNSDDKVCRKNVYKLVRRIPNGRVMTYGQIANILGEDCSTLRGSFRAARRKLGQSSVAQSDKFTRRMHKRENSSAI